MTTAKDYNCEVESIEKASALSRDWWKLTVVLEKQDLEWHPKNKEFSLSCQVIYIIRTEFKKGDYSNLRQKVRTAPRSYAATTVVGRRFLFYLFTRKHSDLGQNFKSELFRNLCEKLDRQKTGTAALHPQSYGMIERMNRPIGKYLFKVMSSRQ